MEKRTILLIIVAIIYWLFPDLLPGVPMDDVLVAIVCALIGKKREKDNKKLIEENEG